MQAARRVRRAAVALSLLVVAALVLAVAFHVTLAQGQLELDRLRQEAVQERERYERVRVEMAAAAAPDEIARRGADLGLVEPPGVVNVSPLPGTSEVVPEDSETSPSTMGNWLTVKPHLGDQP